MKEGNDLKGGNDLKSIKQPSGGSPKSDETKPFCGPRNRRIWLILNVLEGVRAGAPGEEQSHFAPRKLGLIVPS